MNNENRPSGNIISLDEIKEKRRLQQQQSRMQAMQQEYDTAETKQQRSEEDPDAQIEKLEQALEKLEKEIKIRIPLYRKAIQYKKVLQESDQESSNIVDLAVIRSRNELIDGLGSNFVAELEEERYFDTERKLASNIGQLIISLAVLQFIQGVTKQNKSNIFEFIDAIGADYEKLSSVAKNIYRFINKDDSSLGYRIHKEAKSILTSQNVKESEDLMKFVRMRAAEIVKYINKYVETENESDQNIGDR